jgi:hypothetical protein
MFQRRSFATASASGIGAEMLAEEAHAAGLCRRFSAATPQYFEKLLHKVGDFLLLLNRNN